MIESSSRSQKNKDRETERMERERGRETERDRKIERYTPFWPAETEKYMGG